MKKLLLIDANSIIHRSFHALPPFTAPDGQPSGALYGLASILLKLWREERPEWIAALFDRPEPTFREAKYKEYKAQRPPAADELISQIVEAHRLFASFGVKTFEKPGYEADDLIATFAEYFSRYIKDKKLPADRTEADLSQVVILTGDRDTLQLVDGEKIVARLFIKGVSETIIYDDKMVLAKYGLSPEQLVDYKSLVGDQSDNIKGVPGVGPKTATELLQKFGSMDNIYTHLDDDERLMKKIGPFRKEADLSRELVILERHVPIEMPSFDELRTDEKPPEMEEYFEKMGFATLLKRLQNGVDSGRGNEGMTGGSKKEKENAGRGKSGKHPDGQTPLF